MSNYDYNNQYRSREGTNEHGVIDSEEGRKTYAPDGHLDAQGKSLMSGEGPLPPAESMNPAMTGGDQTVDGQRIRGGEFGGAGSSQGLYNPMVGRELPGVERFGQPREPAYEQRGYEQPREPAYEQRESVSENGSEDREGEDRTAHRGSTVMAPEHGLGAGREQLDANAATRHDGPLTEGMEEGEDKGGEAGEGTEGEKHKKSGGKKHHAGNMENPDAIPFAGDKKVGADHFGESTLQKDVTGM